jgi:hypothetical protein
MKSAIALLILALSLTACDEWTNPIPTTPAPEKGAGRLSNRQLPVDSIGAACGTGWSAFHGYYGKELPYAGADTSKPNFWIGTGSDGRKLYGQLNNGQISYGTAYFYCVKD